MRRNTSNNRLSLLLSSLLICLLLIAGSLFGFLGPVESLAAVPLTRLSQFFRDATNTVTEMNARREDIETVRARNAELERSLARLQSEIIELREIASDYERLANLLGYTSSTENREYVTADVVGRGQYGIVRSIIINKGTRSGIAVGMPVVTEQGLVGRVFQVTANYSQVQLITDRASFVAARVEESRAQGSARGEGLESGALELLFLPIEAIIEPGELVFTSGLGGNFPPDIVLGQVRSVTNLESELNQRAQVASFIDFTTLEFVLVITSFEPADLSVFETQEDGS